MNRIAPPEETRVNAFVATKPLQIIVALSIISQLKIAATSVMIIVDSFAGARGVSERLPDLEMPVSNLSSIFVSSSHEAYRYLREHRFSKIFIDSDVGLRRYRDLLLIKLSGVKAQISVYEEGLGTYRANLYEGIKKFVFPLIGAGTYFGGCKLTSSVFLMHPEEYKASHSNTHCKLVRVENGPGEILEHSFEHLGRLFDYSSVDKVLSNRCNIYLSSWELDEEFLSKFESLDGDNYVKPHPHIKSLNNKSKVFLDQAVPAEIIITNLIKRYDSIFVYHHGSSIERYISSDHIHYVRI